MLSLAPLMMRSAGNLPYVKSAGDIFTELPIRNTLLQFAGPLGNSGVIHFLQFATGPTDSGCIALSVFANHLICIGVATEGDSARLSNCTRFHRPMLVIHQGVIDWIRSLGNRRGRRPR